MSGLISLIEIRVTGREENDRIKNEIIFIRGGWKIGEEGRVERGLGLGGGCGGMRRGIALDNGKVVRGNTRVIN